MRIVIFTNLFRKIIFGGIAFFLLNSSTLFAQAFKHPGILNNQSELDFIKDKVKRGEQPWLNAFNALKASTYSSLSYTADPVNTMDCWSYNKDKNGNYVPQCKTFVEDAMASYSASLMWYFTEDKRYATKSIQIINAWSNVYVSNTGSNARLNVSWAAPWFTNAAEILRHGYSSGTSGWSATDIQKFDAMLTKFLPYVKDETMPGNNWIQSAIEAHFAIAIFKDNRTEFNSAVARWKTRVRTYIYQKTDGPIPTSFKSAAIDGVAMETQRDLGHLKLGVNSMMYAAQAAYEQGVDLFTLEQKRLSDFFELHGSWMTGSVAVPLTVNGGLVKVREPDTYGIKPPTGGGEAAFEIAYNHLHTRINKTLYYTAMMIGRNRPANAGQWVFKWETLTHGNLPFNLGTVPTCSASISTTTPLSFCQGGSVVLTSNPGVSYRWMKGTTQVGTAATYTATSSGIYTVEVSNANGCKAVSNAKIVSVQALPAASITSPALSFCAGSNIVLTSSSGTSYKWMNGNTVLGTASTYIATTSGSYTVQVTNANGCIAISSPKIITALPLLIASITTPSLSFCAGGNTVLTSSIGAAYKWMNGTIVVGTASTYTATTSGSYTVEVSNTNGCKATSAPAVVFVTASSTWYADVDGDGIGDATSTKQSCSAPIGYVPTSGDACPTDKNKLAPGLCGCGVTESSCANTPPVVSFNKPLNNTTFNAPATLIVNVGAIDSDGINNIKLYLNGTLVRQENVAPYDWNQNGQDAMLQNMAAGTYVLKAVATDAKGLTGETSITMVVNKIIIATEPIIGSTCGMPLQENTYEINSENRANATNYSWWFSGSADAVNPSADGTSAKVKLSQYFTSGEVCVGVNLSVAPYYVQYCKAVTTCSAAMGLLALAPEVMIYPNPASTNLTVDASNFNDIPEKIEVLNSYGKIVLETTNTNLKTVLSIANLEPGNYSVKTYLNGIIKLQQIVVIK